MVYVRRVVALAQLRSWGIPSVPAIFSVLRISIDFAHHPGVEISRLMSTLCQSLSLSYFERPSVPSRNQSGGRSNIVPREFDGIGGGPPS
jgi:hypothetical protein